MGALVHAKMSKGKKIWYVWGAEGNTKWTKEYPQCSSRFEFYEVLREELGLPKEAGRSDVVFYLFTKTWNETRWEDDFARRLRTLREQAGLTQSALAEKSGLSVQAISALENETRAPKWETVQRLALALGVDEKEFKDTLPREEFLRCLKEQV
jgi:DNA-binding XRE family transcriptional regulator